MREALMQSEQIPKLMIWKTQAVSYVHLDPMLRTKQTSLKLETIYLINYIMSQPSDNTICESLSLYLLIVNII
jgi:hypothetical protein